MTTEKRLFKIWEVPDAFTLAADMPGDTFTLTAADAPNVTLLFRGNAAQDVAVMVASFRDGSAAAKSLGILYRDIIGTAQAARVAFVDVAKASMQA